MKNLVITYGDIVLFDGPVGTFAWSETGAGKIEVKAEPPRQSRPGFLESLQNGSRQQTAAKMTELVGDDGVHES